MGTLQLPVLCEVAYHIQEKFLHLKTSLSPRNLLFSPGLPSFSMRIRTKWNLLFTVWTSGLVIASSHGKDQQNFSQLLRNCHRLSLPKVKPSTTVFNSFRLLWPNVSANKTASESTPMPHPLCSFYPLPCTFSPWNWSASKWNSTKFFLQPSLSLKFHHKAYSLCIIIVMSL